MDTEAMGVYQTIATLLQLAVAIWLYARKLPKRDGFVARAAATGAAALLITVLSVRAGFGMYPTLTDDASFLTACASFVLLLAGMVAAVLALFDAPLWTALFCCSSAYVLQNLAASLDRIVHFTIGQGPNAAPMGSFGDIATGWVCAVLVYGALWVLTIRKLETSALLSIERSIMYLGIALVILVCIYFDLALKDLAMFEVPWRYVVALAAVHAGVCAFILLAEYEMIYSRTLREGIATMERMMAEQARQFEQSRANVDAINRRAHDMRHAVLRLMEADEGSTVSRELLREVAREVDVYASAVKTGNAALDVVLSEKALLANSRGVTLTCVADGHVLDFMEPADVYALFGRALDNAITAAAEQEGNEQQAVGVNVRERMGMASIAIENPIDGSMEFEDDLPARRVHPNGQVDDILQLTGMIEARAIAERYDGTLVCSAEGGTLKVNALLPSA